MHGSRGWRVWPPPLCTQQRAEEQFSTHVHATRGRKDWASTDVQVSTGWTARWVRCHSNESPPDEQLTGYGSAAAAAPGVQRTYRCCCTQGIAVTAGLRLHCSQLSPCYQASGYGGAAPHSSSSARTASNCSPFLAAFPALHRHCSQARPIGNLGAKGVLELPQFGGSSRTAAACAGVMPNRWYCSRTAAQPRRVSNGGARWCWRGAQGGGGQKGGKGCRGGGGTSAQGGEYCSPPLCTTTQGGGSDSHLCAHHHRAEGVRPSPMHFSIGGQISTLVLLTTNYEVEVPSPVHTSAMRRESTPGGGGG